MLEGIFLGVLGTLMTCGLYGLGEYIYCVFAKKRQKLNEAYINIQVILDTLDLRKEESKELARKLCRLEFDHHDLKNKLKTFDTTYADNLQTVVKRVQTLEALGAVPPLKKQKEDNTDD